MKKIVLLLTFIPLIWGCGNSNDKKVTANIIKNPVSAKGIQSDVEMPKISFVDKNSDNPLYFDFGVVIEGEVVSHTFLFKNTGKTNLIIRSTSSSCGCTVPAYPKKPIKPGKTGKIEVSFNSSGRQGRQHKTIHVLSNTQPSSTELVIEANVVIPN